MVYSGYFALQHAHDARDARAHDHAHHKDGNKKCPSGVALCDAQTHQSPARAKALSHTLTQAT